MTLDQGVNVQPQQETPLAVGLVVAREVPMAALGIQIILPEAWTECLSEDAVSKVTELVKKNAQELILEAQQVSMARATRPFEQTNIEDVTAAGDRLSRKALAPTPRRPWWNVLQGLALVGLGATLPMIVAAADRWVVAAAVGMGVVYLVSHYMEHHRS